MTSRTYQMNSINNTNLNRAEYDKCRESKERDMLISQLKAKIFELELREKDYDKLNDKYRQLENEFATLNELNNNLECEKKQKDDEFNKLISNLQSENENLQLGFNDKLSNNKIMFSQNNNIAKQIQLKDAEISDLKSQLTDLENQLNRNDNEKNNLQKVLKGLNDMNNSQNFTISKLLEDNQTLNKYVNNKSANWNWGIKKNKKWNHN